MDKLFIYKDPQGEPRMKTCFMQIVARVTQLFGSDKVTSLLYRLERY